MEPNASDDRNSFEVYELERLIDKVMEEEDFAEMRVLREEITRQIDAHKIRKPGDFYLLPFLISARI